MRLRLLTHGHDDDAVEGVRRVHPLHLRGHELRPLIVERIDFRLQCGPFIGFLLDIVKEVNSLLCTLYTIPERPQTSFMLVGCEGCGASGKRQAEAG